MVFFIFALSFFFATSLEAKFNIGERVSLRGFIDFPQQIDDDGQPLPALSVYFGGRRVETDSEGFFTLPLDREDFDASGQLKTISMMICNEVTCKFEANGNTLSALTIRNPEKAEYFILDRERTEEGTPRKWTVKKTALPKNESGECIISEQCIVVSLNPRYVSSIEDRPVVLDRKFIGLPKVVLKSDTTRAQLKQTSEKSRLKDIDLAQYHATVPSLTKVTDTAVISIQGS